MANFEIKDFENNLREAQDWGEEKYDQWLRSLSIMDRAAITEFLSNAKSEEKIASYLEERKGHLLEKIPENLPDVKKEEFEFLNFFIKHLEKILMKVKVPESIFVYKKIDPDYFFPSISPLRKNTLDQKLDLNVVQTLKNQMIHKEIVHYNFLKTYFTNPESYLMDENVLLKLKVPKGAHAGYVSSVSQEHQIKLLINRGYKIAFEKFLIINEHGREILKIEGSIVL